MCNSCGMTEQPATPHGVPQWDVADRLRKALRESGTSSTEMADYLGVSKTSLSNWINGHFEPSTQTLRLWALRTGVPYEWLISDTNPQASTAIRCRGITRLRVAA